MVVESQKSLGLRGPLALTCSKALLKAKSALKIGLTLKSGWESALSSQLLCVSKEGHGQ